MYPMEILWQWITTAILAQTQLLYYLLLTTTTITVTVATQRRILSLIIIILLRILRLLIIITILLSTEQGPIQLEVVPLKSNSNNTLGNLLILLNNIVLVPVEATAWRKAILSI